MSLLMACSIIEEIVSCQRALNAYAGIPYGKIQGFRAPFRKFLSIRHRATNTKISRAHLFSFWSKLQHGDAKFPQRPWVHV